MEQAIQDASIRKAIAVYYIGEMLERDYKDRRADFAKDIVGKSPSLVSRWVSPNPNERETYPSVEQIKLISEKISRSVESMVQVAVTAKDQYGILKDSEAAKAYRLRNNIGEERTHDDSPAHIKNLRTFTGAEYNLYYLEAGSPEPVKFLIERVHEPESSGYIELRFSRNKKEENHTGTLIAPPQLNRAFIFLEQKNTDGIYIDRGMIVLYFPQERARQQGYQCGVGVTVSLDRHDQHVLLQRVIIVRKELRIVPKAKCFMKSFLELPMPGENILMVADLKKNQRGLYRNLFPDGFKPEDIPEVAEL